MISIEECKQIIGSKTITDEEIRTIRDILYAYCEQICKEMIMQYLEKQEEN